MINSTDRQVLQAKYSGNRFGMMNQEQRNMASFQLLLKIHTVRGWAIPANELMDILVTEFEKKLSESYANVTEEEVMYAFRNVELDIKDWGKSINLSIIDEVMSVYLAQRFELSKMEESRNKPMQLDEKKDLSEEEWNEWIEDAKKYSFEILPTVMYDYLVKNGTITLSVAQKHSLMDKAIDYLNVIIPLVTKERYEFMAMKEKGVFSPAVTSQLINYSKKYALQDYFNSLK